MKGINVLLLTLVKILLVTVFVACSKGGAKSPDTPQPDPPKEQPTDDKIILVQGNNVYGYMLDNANNPVRGVVVTDGYSVVKSNTKGEYQFKKNPKAKFVYYTTPSDYEVAVSGSINVPLFYRHLTATESPKQYDFILGRKTAPQAKFLLYAIGDPQVASTSDVDRFTKETMVDIKAELTKTSLPVYGISLGDVVADQPDLLSSMKRIMGSSTMPVFTTVGNHDKTGTSPSPKDGQLFESQFGPVNYSFDRGDVHFVAMDNVVFSDNSNYAMSFDMDQMDWFEKDLSHVSKDKLLIVYYHMPIRATSFATRTRLLNLVKDYKEVHFMAGHTHYNENYIHNVSGKEIYEHIHAASCGAWWKSTINGDGTPNGYAIYEIDGSTIKNWVYKPTKLSSDFQMRLHWGNTDFGGTHGIFNYGQTSSTLIANVWNSDPAWKVEAHMDGKKLGDMVRSTSITTDAWSKGYHIGVLNRNPDNYNTATKHIYTYKVTNPNNTLKVIATDRFGKKFEQIQLITNLTTAVGY